MEAQPGDHLVIDTLKLGVPPRRGEIVEVIPGQTGEHYRVRWEDDDHETIYFPAAGARIEHATPPG